MYVHDPPNANSLPVAHKPQYLITACLGECSQIDLVAYYDGRLNYNAEISLDDHQEIINALTPVPSVRPDELHSTLYPVKEDTT